MADRQALLICCIGCSAIHVVDDDFDVIWWCFIAYFLQFAHLSYLQVLPYRFLYIYVFALHCVLRSLADYVMCRFRLSSEAELAAIIIRVLSSLTFLYVVTSNVSITAQCQVRKVIDRPVRVTVSGNNVVTFSYHAMRASHGNTSDTTPVRL